MVHWQTLEEQLSEAREEKKAPQKVRSQISYPSTIIAWRARRRREGKKGEVRERKQVVQRPVNLKNPSCRQTKPRKVRSVSLRVSDSVTKG